MTLEWISGMCRYVASHEQGVPMLPFRYEELVENPAKMLSEIFSYCGLPETAVANTLSVFKEDSQRGTNLSRTAVRQDNNNQLTEAHLNQLRAIIQQFPELESPDVILPTTIKV